MGKVALVAGGTGLVGGFLLRELIADPEYSKVVAVVRRGLTISNRKLEQLAVDFDELPPLPRADEAYCCLGTTKAKAGSAEAFKKVDLQAVVNFARAASAAGAKRFFLVSSSGANARSFFLYPRTKGEAEKAVFGFPFLSVDVFRPSLLLGERSERRPMEHLAQKLLAPMHGLFKGPLRRYAPIPANVVARAMHKRAGRAHPGFHVIENEEIFRFGAERV